MERIVIYFKIKLGKRDEYVRRHNEIWPEMLKVLDDAGFRNYSIWNLGNDLFAYYEMKDPQRAKEILASSGVYAKWREEMEEYIFIDEKDQKEWPMEMVFFSE